MQWILIKSALDINFVILTLPLASSITTRDLCSPSSSSLELTLVPVFYNGLECGDMFPQEGYSCYFNGVSFGKDELSFLNPLSVFRQG